MIGSTREAVSKVMSQFWCKGVIETRSRRIATLDRDALSECASGPPGLSSDGQLQI
jgi:Crp-like helix-turn-helix domain